MLSYNASSCLLLLLMIATVTATTITVNLTHLCNLPAADAETETPWSSNLSDNGLSVSPRPSNESSVSPRPSDNGSPRPPDNVSSLSSSINVTELLFAVRKPWTGFAYVKQTGTLHRQRLPPTTGPVALGQMRFPSTKHGENVKLDQQISQTDFDGEGPFGIGFAVGDAVLQFVGVVESTVMWHSVPAELIIDLVTNPYDWDVIVKKVNV